MFCPQGQQAAGQALTGSSPQHNHSPLVLLTTGVQKYIASVHDRSSELDEQQQKSECRFFKKILKLVLMLGSNRDPRKLIPVYLSSGCQEISPHSLKDLP